MKTTEKKIGRREFYLDMSRSVAWCSTHAKLRDERDKLRATLADAICMAQSQGSCLDEDDIKQITEWLTLLEAHEP